MRLTKDEEKMLSGGYGEGYKRAMEILVEMGKFYDAKRMVPVSMAYLIVGPNPAKPGAASKWLYEMADLGTTFKCPLPLVPLDSSTFYDPDVHKRLGAIFSLGGARPRAQPLLYARVRTAHHRRRHRDNPLHELLHGREGQHRVLHRPVLRRHYGKDAGVRLSPPGEQAGEDALRYQGEAEGRDRLERPRLLHLEDPGQELLGRAGDKRDRPRGDRERRPRLSSPRAYLPTARSFIPSSSASRPRGGPCSRPSADASPRRLTLSDPRNCRASIRPSRRPSKSRTWYPSAVSG